MTAVKFVAQIERKITSLAEIEIEAVDKRAALRKLHAMRETLDYSATDADYSVTMWNEGDDQ